MSTVYSVKKSFRQINKGQISFLILQKKMQDPLTLGLQSIFSLYQDPFMKWLNESLSTFTIPPSINFIVYKNYF